MTTTHHDLREQLQAQLVPLPARVLERLAAGDRRGARDHAERFTTEWLGLERRLLELGVGYVRFLHERFGEPELRRATGWVNPALTGAMTATVALDHRERASWLHRVLSQIPTSAVDDPPSEASEPSCEPDTARLLDALRAGDDRTARRAVQRIQHRWPRCQDRIVHLCAGYATWLAAHHGEQVMDDAHLAISGWAEAAMDAVVAPGRTGPEARAEQVLSLLRAHSMDGTVDTAGEHVRVDVDCSSGLRMWRRGVGRFGLAEGPGPWMLGRERLPTYCCRCTTNLMRFHEARGDAPPWHVDPPHDPDDVCRWTLPVTVAELHDEATTADD